MATADPNANTNAKLAQVQIKIDETQAILHQNIDLVLQRGEKISVLVEKSEDLATESQLFKSSSSRLRRFMCCNNAKATAVIVSVVLLFILIISLIIWSSVR